VIFLAMALHYYFSKTRLTMSKQNSENNKTALLSFCKRKNHKT
jgi:hypothetical protein